MNDKLLIVDGEHLLHRSFRKFEKLKNKRGELTGAIFGFFKILHSVIFRLEPTSLIITFDNGRSPYRLNLLPTYKSSRDDSKVNIATDWTSFKIQKRIICRILRLMGIAYVMDTKRKGDYEGDDYVAYYAYHYQQLYNKIIILSGDKDFNQLINEKVNIFNPNKDAIINLRNCKELTGYTPEETVDYLCLVGDKSDNISGYSGIGEVKARKFLDEYGSIQSYLSLKDSTKGGKTINKEELKRIYSLNQKLIDLKYFLKNVPIGKIPLHLKSNKQLSRNKEVYHNKLLHIFSRYDLASFKTNEFIDLFRLTIKKKK